MPVCGCVVGNTSTEIVEQMLPEQRVAIAILQLLFMIAILTARVIIFDEGYRSAATLLPVMLLC